MKWDTGGPTLQEAVSANLPMLKLAEGIAMGSAMIASGGIAGGEIGGTYLLGQAARRADLLSGLSGFSFSTGRAVAATLPEQLSMAEAVANPALGRVVMGGKTMSDTRWLGWNKMEYVHRALDGSKTTVHYVGKWVEGALKAVDDFKFK